MEDLGSVLTSLAPVFVKMGPPVEPGDNSFRKPSYAGEWVPAFAGTPDFLSSLGCGMGPPVRPGDRSFRKRLRR
jgi:hypothetical protein